MKTPELQQIKLKSFKMINNGGCKIEYSYMFSVGSDAHQRVITHEDTTPIHDDLYSILKEQKPNIIVFEEYNYRNMAKILEKMNIDHTDEVSQVAEGLTLEAIKKIEVTGFRIAGTDNKKTVIITYKKLEKNKKIAGRSATNIQLSGDVYGFEQDLEDAIDLLTTEIYEYIFNGKHADSNQRTLPWEDMLKEKKEEKENEE